jgi:hypothetical protein
VSNVTNHKSLGWCQVIKGGVATGWSYRYQLTLECGHKVEYASEVYPNRTGFVSPPGWVVCPLCEAEKGK